MRIATAKAQLIGPGGPALKTRLLLAKPLVVLGVIVGLAFIPSPIATAGVDFGSFVARFSPTTQTQGRNVDLLTTATQDFSHNESSGRSEFSVGFNSKVLKFVNHSDGGQCQAYPATSSPPVVVDTSLYCQETPGRAPKNDTFTFQVVADAPLGQTSVYAGATYGYTQADAPPATLQVTAASNHGGNGNSNSGNSVFGPCAKVTLLAIPGTYETHDTNSTSAVGILKNVTDRLSPRSRADLDVHYIGYPASANYFSSVIHGEQAAYNTMKIYADQCKNTKFVLLGYSQGAQAAGDLASQIGHSNSPIRPDRLLATALLADPRRNASFRPEVGVTGRGGGLAGERGDFGRANSTVTEYCAAHDPVCDRGSLLDQYTYVRAILELFRDTAIGVDQRFPGPHLQYDTTLVPGTGATFTSRMASDLNSVIG